MTLLRRSAALVLTLEGDHLIGFQFLRRARAAVSPLGLRLLARLEVWTPPEPLFADVALAVPRPALARELVALIDAGFVIVAGSVAAAEEERFTRGWRWGAMAAHYHFGIKDPEYGGPVAQLAWMTHQVATTPEPPLFMRNAEPIPLPPPALGADLLGAMARRRSWRGFDPLAPVPLAALRDCLVAGFAILGFAETAVRGEGPLPITTTPSGGARNPFEAYVVARAVADLAPGAYHYAGVDNSLGLVRAAPLPGIDALLGGQAWFARAGAVIFLVATFARSMWKYEHATGLRVVFLEAGHIAQNLLLAADAHGLAATPTCAISDRAVEELFGLDRVAHAAVHAVAIGARGPAPSEADLLAIAPNPTYQLSPS